MVYGLSRRGTTKGSKGLPKTQGKIRQPQQKGWGASWEWITEAMHWEDDEWELFAGAGFKFPITHGRKHNFANYAALPKGHGTGDGVQ